MTRAYRYLVLMLALAFCTGIISAQVPTGTPPFGSFGGGPDIINLANLNVHLTIPVLHKPGRGTNFTYDLSYDSSVWYPVGASGSRTWQPVANWGWRGVTEVLTGYVTYSTFLDQCIDLRGRIYHYTVYTGWMYLDPFGISHDFSSIEVSGYNSICTDSNPYPTTATLTANDGSGLVFTATKSPSATVSSSHGTRFRPPLNSSSGVGSFTDRNGNMINVSTSGAFTDTLGTTALAVAGTAPSNTTFTYTPPVGGSAVYTMKYTTYTLQTNFGCSGITEYGANGTTTASLVSEIDLPDVSVNLNDKYTFGYETTPGDTHTPHYVTGRLVSVTLPTGGTITYTYTGGSNGITCADGSASGLQRYTTDTGSNYWNYARSGTAPATTTTVSDPTGNVSVIQFQGIYETQRDVYQGSTSGTLLATSTTCYNGSASPCNSTAVTLPISNRTVIATIPSSGSATLKKQHVDYYNSVGMPTEGDDWAYGSSAVGGLIKKTLITYASLANITAFRQTVTVQNGAGTPLAQTNYNYDETTPSAAPTGTAQLVSVSGSRGNLTSIQKCAAFVSGSCSNLSTIATMTYDTAGQVQTAKDGALNQTSFDYTDNYFTDNGSNPPQPYSPANPTDAFPKTVTLPMIGAKTFGYYIYSGQGALSTDQNGNNSYTHFDSFGRISTVQGPGQGTTLPWTLTTYATSGLQADTYLGIADYTPSASCSSCRHDQALLDGLGRPIHSYLVNDPEGQTTIDTAYDALGRVLSASHPHRSSASTTDGTETPIYDALGRTIKVTHQDSTYSQTFFGAAVTGSGVNTTQLCTPTTYGLGYPTLFVDEASKRREIWTDGLGRTIEADEPDSSGNLTSATCYTYDPLGNPLQIVHGSQTRSYVYDTLSRPTSVTIPELANSSGTNCAVTYTYDSNSNVQTRTARR